MQIPVDEISAIGEYNYHYVSLDAPLFEDGDGNQGNLIDRMVDEECGSTDLKVDHTQSLAIEIKRILETLNDKEKDIVCKFFGIGISYSRSLQEIAVTYGLTAERIRQIVGRSLKRLQKGNKKHLLKEFLGT